MAKHKQDSQTSEKVKSEKENQIDTLANLLLAVSSGPLSPYMVLGSCGLLAKSLVELGYMLPPVQLGDTVYAAFADVCNSEESIIEPYEVRYIAYDGNKWFVAGKDMELFELGSDGAFLTKEEAEKYLRENDKTDSQTSGKVKKPYESPRAEIIERPDIFASACPSEEDL